MHQDTTIALTEMIKNEQGNDYTVLIVGLVIMGLLYLIAAGSASGPLDR